MILYVINPSCQIKKRYMFLVLCFWGASIIPQIVVAQSYILNGDFEDRDTLCQVTFGPPLEKRGFSYQPISCIHPWGEYSNTQLVFNFKGYMKSGFAAASVLLYKPNESGIYSKSYLIAPLNTGLIKDSLYTIKFFCRLWYKSRFTTNALYVALANESLEFNDYLPLNMNYEFKIQKFLTDTGWCQVEYFYKATGEEKMIVIGNLSAKNPSKKLYDRKNALEEIHCLIDQLSIQSSFKKLDFAADSIEVKNKVFTKNEFEVNKLYIFNTIYFENNSSHLLNQSSDQLYQIARFMWSDTCIHITIVGHTDNVGDSIHNKQLSIERAQSVANEIVKRHVSPQRINTYGKGEQNPIATNDNETGRRKNRRVEFMFH